METNQVLENRQSFKNYLKILKGYWGITLLGSIITFAIFALPQLLKVPIYFLLNSAFGITDDNIILNITFLIIILIIGIFLYPINVGYVKFLLNIANKNNPKVNNVFEYLQSYKQIVKAGLVAAINIYPWYLLFIIPGFIKSLEYYMIPFLIAENPTMNPKDALKISKDLMDGNKWNLFVIFLKMMGVSFIILFPVILILTTISLTLTLNKEIVSFVTTLFMFGIILVLIPLFQIAITDLYLEAKESKMLVSDNVNSENIQGQDLSQL